MTLPLVIENIFYSYRSEFLLKEIAVLKNVSLSLNEGEAFGFLGHNGAGKTTTLKCVLDICRIRKGSINIFGIPHTDVNARKNVGFLPEQPYFYDNLTVLETLQLYGTLYRLSHSRLSKKLEEMLALFHLESRRHAKMKSLSKGLMQRVAMAQAVIAEPRLLILDEPFSGLDPIGRKEFRELLISLRNGGTTILLSSHILSDVETICNRASIMVRGEIQARYDLPLPAHSLEDSFFKLVENSTVPRL